MPISRSDVRIREATSDDEDLLWLMLTFAASMADGGAEQVAKAQADTYLRGYVANWGRQAGDLGVVAVEPSRERGVGAAWLRLHGGDGQFNVGTDTIPELATALQPEWRGAGVGAQMMTALIAMARGRYPALKLSVRESNRAAAFYERLGFRETSRLQNRVGGVSLSMQLDLR